MEKIDENPGLYAAFKQAHDERAAFLYIDIFAGSAGLWIPILVGLILPEHHFYTELAELFKSSGVYTFAIAFLAAASSFIYLERRKNVLNDVREDYSRHAGLHSIVIIAMGMLLVGFQYSNSAPTVWMAVIQALYLGVAVWMGIRLFCLRNIQKIPGELERIKAKQEEERNRVLAEAQNNNPF